MQLKTMEWARGLRASLLAEIDAAIARDFSGSNDKLNVVTYHLLVQQVDHVIAALEADAVATMPVDPHRPN